MDNIETTDTKKKIKFRIFDIVIIGISAVLLGLSIYLKIVGGELFLFGYMWGNTVTDNLFNALMCVWIFIPWINQPKSAKRRNAMISCAVLFVFEVGLISLISWYAYENIKNIVDTEQITLSDGNEILLKERISHTTIGETRFEDTYMDVYQINGIAAKKLGEIIETYFSNKCLSQDKYTYEYDEASKKLTVICEHGSASLEEQNGTGFWEKEFTLQ